MSHLIFLPVNISYVLIYETMKLDKTLRKTDGLCV